MITSVGSPPGSFDRAANLVVALCVAAVCGAVIASFLRAERGRAGRAQRSPVAAGTMTGFCLAFSGMIYAGICGGFAVVPLRGPLRTGLMLAGLALLVVGAAVHVLGRVHLGRNWANQATVYQDQTLVTGGLYAVDPLYASLLWMLTGASLVYLSYAGLLSTMLVFLPMVTARARLEEAMLTERFPEYADYRRRVGRVLPRWRPG